MTHFPLCEVELADLHNEIHDSTDHLVLGVGHLGVIHQHVEQLPGVRGVTLQPENSESHYGVVPLVGFVKILDRKPGGGES